MVAGGREIAVRSNGPATGRDLACESLSVTDCDGLCRTRSNRGDGILTVLRTLRRRGSLGCKEDR
jgi:hypothetical protein